jgi:hypothetical protein
VGVDHEEEEGEAEFGSAVIAISIARKDVNGVKRGGGRSGRRYSSHIKNSISDNLRVNADFVGTLGQSEHNRIGGPEAESGISKGLTLTIGIPNLQESHTSKKVVQTSCLP